MKRKYLIFIFIIGILLMSIPVIATDLNIGLQEKTSFRSEVQYSSFETGYMQTLEVSIPNTVEEVYDYTSLKTLIHSHMKNYYTSFNIRYKGDTSTLKNDINNIWKEIFENDHYLYGTVISYGGYSLDGYTNDVLIKFEGFSYHTNKDQEDFVDNQVKNIINEIIDGNMNDFQKIKAINDWIVNNTVYGTNTIASPHAAYTLFQEGQGVCQAYALSSFKFLEKLGIEVQYVTGYAGESHAWNLVKLNGNWYHLDTTWNDPISSGKDILSYKYFLISDESIAEDHIIDDRIPYPKATDKYYEVLREVMNPVELDGKLFYIGDNLSLYGLNMNDMTRYILTKDRVQFIVGYGNYIYYSNYSQGAYLCRIKTDGTDKLILRNSPSIELKVDYPYLSFYDNKDNKWGKIMLDGITHEVLRNGYRILPLNQSKNDVQYIWTVLLNKDLQSSSVNHNSVYVEDEYGDKLSSGNFTIKLLKDLRSIQIINNSSYTKGKTYYIVVDKALQSLNDGKYLKEAVKLPFIIR